MQNDVEITIAVGASRNSKVWTNTTTLWSEFVQRLRTPVTTPETLKEFLQYSKEDQGRIKDVGGYVGGYLRNGRRNPSNVVDKSVLTLDIDFANTDFFEDFRLLFDNAAFIHATHKHSPSEPRYRLLIPLDRPCSPDEYGAVSRKIAGALGIEMFDNTTFEVNRLMYWPSHPKDVAYYCEEQQGPVLSVDAVLAQYKDWRDTSLWPTSDKKLREIGEAAKKQEDPYLKRGVVGAFCRTYSIREAIETFLPEDYTEGTDGRYTYVKGSTSSGVVIYDDTFAYSHHGTDPAGGKLCNAFDLVRLHKFGHLDTAERSKVSFTKMEELATADAEVKKTIARESYEEARQQFEDVGELEEDDLDWMAGLEINTKGEYLSSAHNINLILQKDRYFKSAFKTNEFDHKRYICGSMPWRKVQGVEPIKNVDYSGIRNYIECAYGISSQFKIEDALALECERNSWHPVKDYLRGLSWDGEPRIERLLIDYFGAEDTLYTREVIKLWLVGAVARIFRPGCKFDYVPVLVDPQQGTFKSTFFKYLGVEWFSDSFTTVQGKEAFEQLQGAWIIEIGELSAMKKSEVETVKHFISKQVDQFRPAYARGIELFPRQCVLAGTTNNKDFLRDPSGNRRFLPVDVESARRTKNVTDHLKDEVAQIWAEAVQLYNDGTPLYLSSEVELMARVQQELHSESDERIGIIEKYLDTPLLEAKDWNNLELFEKRAYFESDQPKGTRVRQIVCTAEIWCECLGKEKKDLLRYNTKDINDLMRSMPGWRSHLSTKNFNGYGKQRYYERVECAKSV